MQKKNHEHTGITNMMKKKSKKELINIFYCKPIFMNIGTYEHTNIQICKPPVAKGAD
jgi:hypothetical protein